MMSTMKRRETLAQGTHGFLALFSAILEKRSSAQYKSQILVYKKLYRNCIYCILPELVWERDEVRESLVDAPHEVDTGEYVFCWPA